jgi:hypothetical protein
MTTEAALPFGAVEPVARHARERARRLWLGAFE